MISSCFLGLYKRGKEDVFIYIGGANLTSFLSLLLNGTPQATIESNGVQMPLLWSPIYKGHFD